MEKSSINNNMTTFQRGLKYGAIAGVIYFVIAFVTNRNYAMEQRLISSSSHGLFCLIMTFFSTSMMESFFNAFKGLLKKYCMAVLCSGMVSLSLMITIHIIIDTPEIVTTVLFSALTSAPYYLLFPLKLVFEYEQRIDRLSYRRDHNWSREWKVQSISRPYGIKDFLKVVLLNLTKISKSNECEIEFTKKNFKLNDCESDIRLGFLGDLMPMYKKSWSLDNSMKDFFSEIDYLVCNFEGLVSGLMEEGGVLLSQNHSTQILEELTNILPAEKIILSVANNHSADYGIKYFYKNVEFLESLGFKVIGLRDRANIVLEDRINLVGATQWSNQHHGYLSFLENSSDFKVDGKVNILYPHWGYELEMFPRKEFHDQAMTLIEEWDGIVGHHSHIPGPVTVIDSIKKKPLIYSLGDSSTGLPRRRYKHGIALTLDIGRDVEGGDCISQGTWSFTKLMKASKGSMVLSCREECDL